MIKTKRENTLGMTRWLPSHSPWSKEVKIISVKKGVDLNSLVVDDLCRFLTIWAWHTPVLVEFWDPKSNCFIFSRHGELVLTKWPCTDNCCIKSNGSMLCLVNVLFCNQFCWGCVMHYHYTRIMKPARQHTKISESQSNMQLLATHVLNNEQKL